MNQTPTMPEAQISMIQMMDYDKPPIRFAFAQHLSPRGGKG